MSVFQPKFTDKRTGKRIKSRVWWYEFVYVGERIRGSAKTTRKTVAERAEEDHRLRLERAHAGMATEAPKQRIKTVADVLKAYQGQYGVNHRDNSLVIVANRSKHLTRKLGSVLLPDLNQARLTEYMEQRREEKASNRTINMELMVLSRAVGYTWKALWPKLKKLQENQDVGRALEPEEEKRVLAAAVANPSKLIYPFLMTLSWTGIRSDEARTLRWSQVDFEAPQIRVGKSKTEAGARRAIPMSGALKAALEQHAAFCARKLGPLQPEWYVFPLSNRTRPVDATRPVTSLKTAWETVKTGAGVVCRLHDLRHSFCTKLAEAGVPESTMLDMMGHVSAAMLRRYSHIRAKARREAIDALEGRVSVGVPKESPKVAVFEEKAKKVTCLVS
jgi:integrase